MKLEFYLQIFEKYLNVEFHKNPSSRSPVISCRQMEKGTDIIKLIVAFCNFVNVPKNEECILKINIKRIGTDQIWLRFGVSSN